MRRSLCAALALALLAACSSAHKAPARPAEPSAWRQTLDRIGPDGQVDLPTALAAFALAIGPVPGAALPAGPAEPIASGTLAVRWVLAHWAELSAEQRDAVRTALDLPKDANAPAGLRVAARPARAPMAPAADPHLPCQKADSPDADRYRAMLPDVEAAITPHLGALTIAGKVFLAVNTKNLVKTSTGRMAALYTVACTGTNPTSGAQQVTGCTVHVNPAVHKGQFTDADVRTFLIHEMTHCFLYNRFGTAYDHMPDWYAEGAPTWAESVLGTGNAPLDKLWQEYLANPTRPLTQRAYDGVGFFVHLAETGADVWKTIREIGTALAAGGGTPAGWKAAGLGPAFLDSWGAGFLQGRYPGKAWTTGGPNLGRLPVELPQGRLAEGPGLTITSAPYGIAAQRIEVDAAVVLVNAQAGTSGRITLGGGADATFGAGPYCTVADCACPPGSPGQGATFEKMSSGGQWIGLTGGDQAGSVTLVGQSLKDFCAKPFRPCLVGQWTSANVDVRTPHISEHGGAGVRLHIDPKGNTTLTFYGMAPVTFTGQTGSSQFTGTLTYAGTLTSTMVVPAGTSGTGTWQEAKPADMSRISATVHVTKPFAVTVGPYSLAQFAGSAGGAGAAVSGKPVLTGGWTCGPDTLVTTPPPNSAVSGSWTFNRTGPG
jgi:hypothetical protein